MAQQMLLMLLVGLHGCCCRCGCLSCWQCRVRGSGVANMGMCCVASGESAELLSHMAMCWLCWLWAAQHLLAMMRSQDWPCPLCAPAMRLRRGHECCCGCRGDGR